MEESVPVPAELVGRPIGELIGYVAWTLGRGFLVQHADVGDRIVRGPLPERVSGEEVLGFLERQLARVDLQLVQYGQLLCVVPDQALIARWGMLGKSAAPYLPLSRLAEVSELERVVTTFFLVREGTTSWRDLVPHDDARTTVRRLDSHDLIVMTAPGRDIGRSVRALRARGLLGAQPEWKAPVEPPERAPGQSVLLQFDEVEGTALDTFAEVLSDLYGRRIEIRPPEAASRRITIIGQNFVDETELEAFAESVLMGLRMIAVDAGDHVLLADTQRLDRSIGSDEPVDRLRWDVPEGDLSRYRDRWTLIRTRVETSLDAPAVAELLGAFCGDPRLESVGVDGTGERLVLEGLAANVCTRVRLLRDMERTIAGPP